MIADYYSRSIDVQYKFFLMYQGDLKIRSGYLSNLNVLIKMVETRLRNLSDDT